MIDIDIPETLKGKEEQEKKRKVRLKFIIKIVRDIVITVKE